MKTAISLRQLIFTLIAGAAGAVFVLVPLTTFAAGGSESFQISPPTANFSGNRGSTVTGSVKVTNLTSVPLTVNVGKTNFVALGEEGQVELINNADPLYSLAPWFNPAVAQVVVPPKSTVPVSYSIGIPVNAEPGGRYGSITMSTIPPKLASGQSGASVEQTLASLIFLRINGPAKEQLRVETFSTNKSFYQYGPVQFLTRIKDTGNVHEMPMGTITIKNMIGGTTAKLSLDQHYVIPTAIRRWYNTLGTSSTSPFLFGRYTATLNATYAGDKSLSATVAFVVFPYKLVAVILIILLLIILFIWKGRKRFGRAFRILAGRE